MLGCKFLCLYAGKGPVNGMNQLKSIYNSSFKDLHSHHIHTHFAMIASNEGAVTGHPVTKQTGMKTLLWREVNIHKI